MSSFTSLYNIIVILFLNQIIYILISSQGSRHPWCHRARSGTSSYFVQRCHDTVRWSAHSFASHVRAYTRILYDTL